MKVKHSQKLLLIFMFCLILLGVKNSKINADSIKVDSQNVPQSAISSVLTKWQQLAASKLIQDNKEMTDYYLGTPFSMENETLGTYLFPIINKITKDIVYTIEVPADEKYYDSLIISGRKAKEINSLSKQLNTKEDPVRFYQDNYEVGYLYQGNTHTLIKSSMIINNTEIKHPSFKIDTKTVEITDKIADPTLYMYRSVMPELQEKILLWHPFELQSNLPICYLYCLSEVVNNQLRNFDLTAVNLAKLAYPGITDDQISKGQNMFVEGALKYLNTKYNQKITFVKKTLPFSELKKEVDSESPVVVDLQNQTQNDGNHDHAMVLIGYTMTADNNTADYPPYYTYWNPWWSETFMVSSKSSSVFLDNAIYKPFRTTYNFHIK